MTNNTVYPLNGSQRGVYFECVENPLSTKYNIAFALTLPSSADADRLEAAVRKVVEMHPALLSALRLQEGEPVMVPGAIAQCNFSRTAAGSLQEAKDRFIRPFDLENGPLHRFELCSTPEGNLLLLDALHCVFDGTSLRLLLRQISDAYDGRPLEAEDLSLEQFNQGEAARNTEEACSAAMEVFRRRLQDVEWGALPSADAVAPQEGQGLYSVDVPRSLDIETVTKFVRESGATANTLFMSAFSCAMAAFTASGGASMTIASSGRTDSRLASTVGMFVKILPLYIEVKPETKVRDFLRENRAYVKEAVDNNCLNFSQLSRAFGVGTEIAFAYQSDMYDDVKLGEGYAQLEELTARECMSDIFFMVYKRGEGYRVNLFYNKALYTEKLMESLCRAVFTAAEQMMKVEKLEDISLLSAEDKAAIDAFNRTETPFDSTLTVNAVFEEAVRRDPRGTAVVCGGRSYTFEQLDRISAAIAANIASRGIGREDFVAVLVPRNEYMALSAWGVIRSGAAFQPLDPTYPAERLEYMISDSHARLLIADRSLLPLVGAYEGEVLFTDEIGHLTSEDGFKADVRPEDALTMIYTSGTTGKPKGCVLENRNIAAFWRNNTEIMQMDSASRIASYASFGFDAGVMDVVTTPMTGATLYIIPDEIRLDLLRLEEFFCSNGITHAFMTTQLGRMFAQQTKCRTLKVFQVGGEKLVPFTPPENFHFFNAYGPCETMCYICHHEVDSSSPVQPIGTASGNTKLYVADSRLRLQPVGAVGELCISGCQVGRGYLGLPEKTAEVFVPNPFDGDKPGYERMYRTGDIVRLLPSGELEYIGRRDAQVKIRGFRVELTEVEEVIRRFEGISDATVAAFDDPAGGKFIAAYVVGDSKIDISSLEDFIRAEKPAYMVPAVTMQIDAIPYTQNQKVNRRALPQPVRESRTKEKVKPSGAVQQKIFDIAVSILGHEDFGVTTDLFEAGMTSIGMLKFNVALGGEFGTPVTVSDLRERSTIKALEAFLTEGEQPGAAWLLQDDYPLMQNQMGVFIDSTTQGASIDYNIPLLMKISPSIEPEKLQQAVCRAVDAHPYMKAVLSTGADGSVRALRSDDAEPVVEIIKADTLPEAKDLVVPFEIVGGPLYRIKIFVTPKDNYLFFDIHHIVADGTSMAILLSDIDKALAGEMPQKEQYTAFEAALDEERLRAGEKYAQSEKYFEELLSGCNSECLPAKCPEKGAPQGGCAKMTFSLAESSAAVAQFCRANNLSLNACFNAAFGYVLSEFIHSDEVTYCTVYNGRGDSRLAGSFAMLVKTLPVCCHIEAAAPVTDFVRKMQQQLVSTMSCDALSFAEISNRWDVKPDIFFNYQGDNFIFDSLGGRPAEAVQLDLAVAKAPLSVEVFLRDGVFSAEITYRTDFFCKEMISSLASSLEMVLKGFAQGGAVGEVSLLAPQEKVRFDAMNDTDVPVREIPAQALFEQWVAREPDRIAASTSDASLTYAQMDSVACRIASSLVRIGASGSIVGLLMERSVMIPTAEIGIMKAGCAFLPMLPSYPDDRLEFCLRDASVRYVVTTKDIIASRADLFSADKPYRALALEQLVEEGEAVGPQLPYDPHSLAYCIYTSGSTGTPKGVMIEQHNLSNYVQTSGLNEALSKGSTILCMSSISFDMSIAEMFGSLCQGKTLRIASEEEVHNLDKLLKAFTGSNVDLMMMTPSFAWSILSLPEFASAMAGLKAVVLGAEAFPPALFDRLKALNPDMFVQNGYGPTECTQACSAKTISDGGNITIGNPFANTKFHVMDNRGNLLPTYAVGELIISGECVCRGYVGLPEKNKAAFFTLDGLRSYHSGDLVRVNRDGEVEFGGRKDNQVKLRGFRIELDEVEAVMQEFEGVKQSKVVVRNNGNEDFLAGFFTADRKIEVEDLAAFMKTKLTYYMVPSAMMQLERMPMTSGGKLDKKALPEIKPVKKDRVRRAPKKSLEAHVIELFCSVLGQEECYPDDNFFEIGGTSLSASKVVMMLKSDGYKVEYQDIFDNQTAEALAEFLEAQKAPAAAEACSARQDSSVVPPMEKYVEEALKFNTMEYASKVERKPLGDVLLTGATGFLGIHILKELLETEPGRIYCLMRKGMYKDLTTRLKSMLFYYFDDAFDEKFDSRLTLIEGDITDDGLGEVLADVKFDTLINCAACVKHYANDNSIEFINVHGVENLIRVCRSHDAKMIQISTTSVPGAHNAETFRLHVRMTEDKLFVIDDLNNQYGRSKYKAELLMLKAISEGMKGKIVRVGNLMGRSDDGEFQINMRSNAFLNALKGFVVIGKCPISHATDPMGFSAIDCTAKAVVLLAGTNDCFTAFNADSRWAFDEMKVIEAVNSCGLQVVPVKDEEYYADFYRMMGDASKNEKISALLTNDRPDIHILETDNCFTANILYRLGFSWPFIDNAYLEKVIRALDTLEFFS